MATKKKRVSIIKPAASKAKPVSSGLPGPREAADRMRANLAKLPDSLRITFLHGFWEAMRYSCFCEQENHGLRANKYYMALQLEIEKELDAATKKNAVKNRK